MRLAQVLPPNEGMFLPLSSIVGVLVRRVNVQKQGRREDEGKNKERGERESHERERDTSDYSLRLVSNSNRCDTSALHHWELSILVCSQVVEGVIGILPFSIDVINPLSPEPELTQ